MMAPWRADERDECLAVNMAVKRVVELATSSVAVSVDNAAVLTAYDTVALMD